MTPNRRNVASAGAVCILAFLVCSRDVCAQAWVPAQGEGAVAISFQDLDVTRHLASTTRVDAGHINSVVLLADVTYGVTDKVAIDVALPFVSSKYRGPYRHPNTTIDDGTFHSSFTDVRMAVRYNLTRKGTVLTPYIGTIVPSHDYPYYGHAAAGERLHELQVGTYAAKLFTAGVPGLFVTGRLAYGFVEHVQDISHNRSMGDLEVGYFVGQAFRVFATAAGQYTHGGIDFPAGGLPAVPLQYKSVHDIIQRVHYVHAGGGFAYSAERLRGRVRLVLASRRWTERPRAEQRHHAGRKLELQPSVEARCGRGRRRSVVEPIRSDGRQASRLARPVHLPEVRDVAVFRCATGFRSIASPATGET